MWGGACHPGHPQARVTIDEFLLADQEPALAEAVRTAFDLW
jgi:hypothetical protein